MKGCTGLGANMNSVIGYWLESLRYVADVQQVMALRMIKFARGGPRAFHEAVQMTTEKEKAFGEAQFAGAVAVANGQPPAEVSKRMAKPYHRRVKANLKRLRKSSKRAARSHR